MVDLERVEAVYADLPPAQEISGGSAANTVAGLASFGASSAFIARVRDDQLGKVFTHDLRSLGVHFDVPAGDGRPGHRTLPRGGHARRPAHACAPTSASRRSSDPTTSTRS